MNFLTKVWKNAANPTNCRPILPAEFKPHLNVNSRGIVSKNGTAQIDLSRNVISMCRTTTLERDLNEETATSMPALAAATTRIVGTRLYVG